MGKVVAIHQPNFFPWLGYFDKILRCDVFIFLDHVQFPKTGGGWTNRVKMLVNGEARWVTAAIDRSFHGTRKILEMRFMPDNPWREKALRSIEASYRRHPHYGDTMEVIAPLLLSSQTNIAEYNIQAVTTVARCLGIDIGKLQRSSALAHEGTSNELLSSLTRSVGGDTYMCGGGADGYQEEAIFNRYGVTLLYQSFSHPVYAQKGREDFVTGLSIVDAAMNLGWDGVGNLLRSKPKNVAV